MPRRLKVQGWPRHRPHRAPACSSAQHLGWDARAHRPPRLKPAPWGREYASTGVRVTRSVPDRAAQAHIEKHDTFPTACSWSSQNHPVCRPGGTRVPITSRSGTVSGHAGPWRRTGPCRGDAEEVARVAVRLHEDTAPTDHEPPHLAILRGVRLRSLSCSSRGSMTRTALPSTTTYRPFAHVFAPVVTATCALASRLRIFCSSGPVAKKTAPRCKLVGRLTVDRLLFRQPEVAGTLRP